MELFYAEGPAIVREIRRRGHRIFLDLKLHDIPNTVKKAMAALSALDVDIVNLHAAGTAAMMTAALEGLTRPDGTRPLLIAVTQLTSTDQERMERELLIHAPLEEVVLSYAANAAAAGLDGVVCSPLEAGAIHRRCGASFLTVTPGVRFAGGDAGDQKRVTTPAKARELGSDYIVVGRPDHAGGGPRGCLSPLRKGVCGLMRWNTVLFDLDGTVTDPKEGITLRPWPTPCGSRASSPSPRYPHPFHRPAPPRELPGAVRPDGGADGPGHPGFPSVLLPAGLGGEHPLQGHGRISGKPAKGRAEAGHCHLQAGGLCPTHHGAFRSGRLLPPHLWGAGENRASARKGSVVADALRRSGTDGPAVMVGDRRFDIAGAHENGLPAIGVLYGYGGREELENAGADYLAADLHELKQLLLQE